MDFGKDHGLIREYLEEAEDFLGHFDSCLLLLEQGVGQAADPAVVTEILSLLHTFKGNSGMMTYTSLQGFVHALEDLFELLKSGDTPVSEPFVEFAMSCASSLKSAVSGISPETPDEPLMSDETDAVARFIKSPGEMETAVPGPLESAAGVSANPFERKTNLLKVDFERLDSLLNLVGELVIYRTRLGRVDTQFKETYGERGHSQELSDVSEQIGKITTELHEAIMKVRMLPVKNVFMRFPRAIRDLAKQKGKNLKLVFEGEETELDKTVIDEIGEPLLHLLRNAVDHGIETPEERVAAGKPAQGTISLKAFQESNNINIIAEDDGRGIDKDLLRRKAEESGAYLKEDLARRDLVDLIFLPGLSTAGSVDEVSGRGLGMEVVKNSLAKISGSIEVQSEPGAGTRFTIKLPLTLAIISALMVEVSGEQFAIPLPYVLESIKPETGKIHEVNHREVIKVRDRILPLVRIGEQFNLAPARDGDRLNVVVVQSTAGQMGIVVDALVGRQEIVIKALDDYLGGSMGIAGATILGDGKVVLIVDVPALVEKLQYQAGGSDSLEARNA